MRCRKHPSESPVGVCAFCLRERLLDLLEHEEERRFKFTQSLHISSPSTFYEERSAQISEEQEAENLQVGLGILFAGSQRQSKVAIDGGNTDPKGKLNREKLPPVGLSRFLKSPDVPKSKHIDKSPENNHRRNEGLKENEVPASSPVEELPRKPSSWFYSWLLRRKRKTSYQANDVADKSYITAMSSLDDISSKKYLEDLDLFNRHHDALRAQLSPIQRNLRVFSAKHCSKQESKYFPSSSFLGKRGTKILNIFRKESSARPTPQRCRESNSSKVDNCLESGSIHHRNGLYHCHARGASPSSSVNMESEDDPRISPFNRPGLTCNSNSGAPFSSSKGKAGKTEGYQYGRNYKDCAGSFSPYVERRSMQSPNRFPAVSNELSGLWFCLSPLKKPGRKLYPQASI